jgi:hypothetical protein
MRAAPPGNEIVRFSIPALLLQERRHGLSKACLHIDNGAVLVERQHFNFALQNVRHITHCFAQLAPAQSHAICAP